MLYLLLIDTSGIQGYIFKTNEMKFIAKASQDIEGLSQYFNKTAEGDSVNLIVSAGGNAAFWSDNQDSLKQVCRSVSSHLIEKHPGLEVVAVIHPFEKDQLVQEYRIAGTRLEQKKLTQKRSLPFTFPGLMPEVPQELSPIKPFEDTDYMVPNQTEEQMIAKINNEESDIMAVVTMDGLKMGSKFLAWLSHAEEEEYDDSTFIQEFRDWSEYLKKRWEKAWSSAMRDIITVFPASEPKMLHAVQGEREMQLHWVTESNSRFASKPFLPARKIFQGGDDLTFICDAHISISLVRNLVFYLEQEETDIDNIPKSFRRITVSAGAVILDSHFPFVRAVGLADKVRKDAKKSAMKANSDNPPSRFDWWINRSGALERLEVPEDSLENPNAVDIRSAIRACAPAAWDRFEREDLTGAWKTFRESRNKLKALAEAAQDGAAAVKEFLALRGVPDAEDSNVVRRTLDFLPEGQNETGFDGTRTALLDIAELFDIHFPLPRKITEEVAA